MCPCCCDADEGKRLLSNDTGITKIQFATEVAAMLIDATDKEPKKKKKIERFEMMFVEKNWLMTREIFVYYTRDESEMG